MCKNVSKLLSQYVDENRLRFEGDSGVQSLEKIAEALGYRGHAFRYGSPLEHFLSDNPGACEALVEWIGEQNPPEWQESLEYEVEGDEEEDDDDDE